MVYPWGCDAMEETPAVVEYDPYDWQIHEDPYPVYRQLRDEAPCYHNADLGFYALSRYDDVLTGFRDWEGLSNEGGVALEQASMGPGVQQVMSFLGMDPPRHDAVRNLVSRAFTPRRVKDLEGPIRTLARHYLDTFANHSECDFIAEFAGKLPMDVISEMVGVAPADRDMLRTRADRVVHREEGNSDVPPEGSAAAIKLLQYFGSYVTERRKRPGNDDLTDALIAAELDGEKLVDFEIVAFLFLMIIAGNETTTKLLGNALYWAWRNPDQRKRVVEDPSLALAWAEETLRYDPSSQLIARTATRELEFHGVKIEEGAKVALLIGSANRDERFWERPAEYDVTRNTAGSLAFGQGTHFCLGASLARLEAQISLEEVLKRIPDYAVREEGIERVHSSNVRGFAVLPLEFPR
jgi:cytochrome P450